MNALHRTLQKLVDEAVENAISGALYASIVGLGATGTGVTGIFGLLLCLNDPLNYIIMFLISAGVAFALTWMFGYKDKDLAESKK